MILSPNVSLRSCQVKAAASKGTKRVNGRQSQSRGGSPQIIPIELDGSDMWRLGAVVDLIADGKVGIIPTDTLPAIVCDLENRDAVIKLYTIKDLDPKKPLSILVHSFKEIQHYTAGFPASNEPGQPNWFNVMRRLLPGPGKKVHRKAVGVRMPDSAICQDILQAVGRPLLCTSVHVPEHMDDTTEVPDVGSMLELYENKGIDFIVDVGRHFATCSTVVDMTGSVPEVTRVGKGDPSVFGDFE
eukprot:gene17042-23334_t